MSAEPSLFEPGDVHAIEIEALDVLECPRCLARTRILAAIHPPDATPKILDCLGLPSRAPPLAAAVSEPTAQLDWF